jgi:hypothetical protein
MSTTASPRPLNHDIQEFMVSWVGSSGVSPSWYISTNRAISVSCLATLVAGTHHRLVAALWGSPNAGPKVIVHHFVRNLK